MAYILETVTQADQEKIINDAACDAEKQGRLARAQRDQEFSKKWAIDRERNCYLMFFPIEMMEEVLDYPYMAFVNGHMYRINRLKGVGNTFYFDEQALPDAQEFAVVQEEICAAFAVYGAWGTGPLDKFGAAVNVIVPQFSAKPKGAF